MAENGADAGKRPNRAKEIVRTVTIQRPAADLYRFWRDLPNLGRVFQHGLRVTAKTREESHWSATVLGKRVEWDATISMDEPDRVVGWRARPGAPLDNAGSVRFEPAPNGATAVTLAIEYEPPGGIAGAWAAGLLSKGAGEQLEAALDRFKKLMEGDTAGVGL